MSYKTKIRYYEDIHGKRRKIEFIKYGPFVRWSKKYPNSLTEKWKIEDGSIVQIPINAWDCLGIKYTDREK